MTERPTRRQHASTESFVTRRDLDPHQHFEKLRERAPIAWDDEMKGWPVTSYEHCSFVERNEGTFATPYVHHSGGAEIQGRHNLLILTGEKHRALQQSRC